MTTSPTADALMLRATKQAAHRILSRVRGPSSRRRLGRAIDAGQPPYWVNIGAGLNPVEGWLNTDIHWRTPFYMDLLSPWPFPSSSVRYVYGDNVVEHFAIRDLRTLLFHARAALAPGGTIRFATPDVEAAAREYLNRSAVAEKHLERHKRVGYDIHYTVDLLRVVFAESEHWRGYCYDEQALRSELESAGFVNVRRCRAGESGDPNLSGLERRSIGTDSEFELVLEADRE